MIQSSYLQGSLTLDIQSSFKISSNYPLFYIIKYCIPIIPSAENGYHMRYFIICRTNSKLSKISNQKPAQIPLFEQLLIIIITVLYRTHVLKLCITYISSIQRHFKKTLRKKHYKISSLPTNTITTNVRLSATEKTQSRHRNRKRAVDATSK